MGPAIAGPIHIRDPRYAQSVKRLAVAAIVFVTAGSSAAATTRSGLYGFVRRGPIVPVCVAGQPCDGPARNMTLVFWRNGKAVGRTKTSRTGAYRIRLAPGVYTMRPAGSATIGRGAEPPKARVVAGRFRRVDFFVDTGIR
jgi:hypothetical protein